MKVNLLPTYVSKEGQLRTMLVLSVLMLLGAVAASIFMIVSSRDALAKAKARAEEAQPVADRAVQIARQADTIIQSATGLDRNIKLSEAMAAHNPVYLELYKDVLRYVPSFYRVTSISATPVNETTCNVTMTGVLSGHQQYADLVLALYRMEGVQRITRSGFTPTDQYVPGLNLQDQIGLPIRPGEPRLPSDPLQRLDALVAQNARNPGAFEGVGGFGAGQPGPRGAGPGFSAVSVNLVLQNVLDQAGKVVKSRDLRTPNPRATIQAAGGAGAAPAAGGPNPARRPGGPGGNTDDD
jgi:hypothetical protein